MSFLCAPTFNGRSDAAWVKTSRDASTACEDRSAIAIPGNATSVACDRISRSNATSGGCRGEEGSVGLIHDAAAARLGVCGAQAGATGLAQAAQLARLKTLRWRLPTSSRRRRLSRTGKTAAGGLHVPHWHSGSQCQCSESSSQVGSESMD